MNDLSSSSIGIAYNINQKVEIRLHGCVFLETANFNNFVFLNEDVEYTVDHIELNENILSITIGGITRRIISNVKEVVNIWKLITSIKNTNYQINEIDTKLDLLISDSGIKKLRIYDKSQEYDRFIDINKKDTTFHLQTYKPRTEKEIISIILDKNILKIITEDDQYTSIELILHPLISNIIKNNIE